MARNIEKQKARDRKWREENKARLAQHRKNWLEKHPDYLKEYHARNKARADELKEIYKSTGQTKNWVKARKAKRVGITAQRFDEMMRNQGGVCAICHSTNKNGNALSIDHNHKTGKVRSLLCSNCNFGIGYFYEDISKMENALRYLKKWNVEEVTEMMLI